MIMILANCRPMGVTLIFSYIRRLWLFRGGGGFKILNFNIFWGFQKNDFFGELRFCDFFFFFFWGGGGHHNIGLYLGAISMHFRVFFNLFFFGGGAA